MKDKDYVCPQCGADPNGSEIHSLTHHTFPPLSLEEAKMQIEFGHMTGYKTHRHEKNPKEKEIHDKFIKDYVNNPSNNLALEQICLPTDERGEPRGYLTDRERQLVITAIQWLGSPVGEGFLKSCGFKLEK